MNYYISICFRKNDTLSKGILEDKNTRLTLCTYMYENHSSRKIYSLSQLYLCIIKTKHHYLLKISSFVYLNIKSKSFIIYRFIIFNKRYVFFKNLFSHFYNRIHREFK